MNNERAEEIRASVAATPPKFGVISQMTPAQIAQVLTGRADLLDERDRLLAVVEAAEMVERTRSGPMSSFVASLGLLDEALRAYRAATTGEAGQ